MQNAIHSLSIFQKESFIWLIVLEARVQDQQSYIFVGAIYGRRLPVAKGRTNWGSESPVLLSSALVHSWKWSPNGEVLPIRPELTTLLYQALIFGHTCFRFLFPFWWKHIQTFRANACGTECLAARPGLPSSPGLFLVESTQRKSKEASVLLAHQKVETCWFSQVWPKRPVSVAALLAQSDEYRSRHFLESIWMKMLQKHQQVLDSPRSTGIKVRKSCRWWRPHPLSFGFLLVGMITDIAALVTLTERG